MTFKVGDRVKLSADGLTSFPEWTEIGLGTVLGFNSYVLVQFDNHASTQIGSSPAYMLESELEPLEDLQAQIDALTERYEKLLEGKNAGLAIAAKTFKHYSELHFEKNTDEAAMKAFANLGLERTMLNALEAD